MSTDPAEYADRDDRARVAPLRSIRADFPALADGTAYFDGPGGTQVPRQVAEAVATTLTSGISNRGTLTAAERRAEETVQGFRAAVADLLGADPRGVVAARSATQATYDLSRTLAKQWGPGDEVVVTRLDHDSNIRPWLQAAHAVGAQVRWAEFDPDSGELPVAEVERLLSRRTRLVAVTGASNVLGTRPDLPAIAAAAHRVGALVWVDAVHLTPHAPIDVAATGADFLTCSPYKFLGPHHGIIVAAPELLESLQPDKLRASSDAVPERFELGTLPYELLAGTTASIDYLAGLADPAAGEDAGSRGGSRRARLLASMAALEQQEHALLVRLLDGLRGIGGVRLLGDPAHRTPTVFFTVAGRPPQEVAALLAARGVNAPASHFYAWEACHRLGLGEAGAVRAGVAPYTTEEEVDRLLAGVAEAARRD